MDYSSEGKKWAEGFSKGARGEGKEKSSGEGLLDKVKSVFGGSNSQAEALRRRKETAYNRGDDSSES